ncbi:hypothetical protein EVAR_84846_1 [Eumeta japonica]|uniref:Uncharacterized protein n=1 Tax=Eumeta variegata TaxID=151549 RepID=A0A4C2A083_EUMVA|nr:hypothetical protein EVAR_84846_1 [Eumeta japonica]
MSRQFEKASKSTEALLKSLSSAQQRAAAPLAGRHWRRARPSRAHFKLHPHYLKDKIQPRGNLPSRKTLLRTKFQDPEFTKCPVGLDSLARSENLRHKRLYLLITVLRTFHANKAHLQEIADSHIHQGARSVKNNQHNLVRQAAVMQWSKSDETL